MYLLSIPFSLSVEMFPTMSQKSKYCSFSFWVDPEILKIASTFDHKSSLEGDFLDVGPSSDWGEFISEEDKRIRSEYGEYVIPFYECTFSILGLHLPFNDLEIEVLNYLIISHSQLNRGSWAYIKFFQYWCDYQGWKLSLSLFFHLFRV